MKTVHYLPKLYTVFRFIPEITLTSVTEIHAGILLFREKVGREVVVVRIILWTWVLHI